jgi:hypothetical protein
MDKNNTNFPAQLEQALDDALNISTLSDKLFYYQQLVIIYTEMMISGKLKDIKGLAIWHEPGMGKTILGLALGDVLSAAGYKVNFMTPKSLRDNFEKKGIAEYNDLMKNKEGFVPISSNKFSFLTRSHTIMKQISETVEDIGKIFDTSRNKIKVTKIQENTVFLIDESHQVLQLIANGSPAWVEFYETIMKSPNAIVIFLSGSLFSSSIFELVPLFNMISRKQLFPEIESEFRDLFWDQENKIIKHRAQFQNRCFGMVSYMTLSFLGSENLDFYPREEKVQIIKCPMVPGQLEEYVEARKSEIKDAKFTGQKLGKPSVKRFESTESVSGSYRVVSSQYCNFEPIPEILELKQKNKDATLDQFAEIIKRTPTKYFHNNKFLECRKIVNKFHNRKGIILSRFTGAGGALSIGEGFIRDGYSEVTPNLQYEPGKNFAVVNGSLTTEEQTKIIELYNSPKNDDGSIVHFLIIGLQQAMGLDLQSAVFAIMYELYWIYLIWQQFKKRINRYKAHARLPVGDRVTYPYMLMSVYPDDVDPKIPNAFGMRLTTDEHLYKAMMNDKNISKQFKQALSEVAIECSFVKKRIPSKICRMCNPNNRPLYTDNDGEKSHQGRSSELIRYDCTRDDPCDTSPTEEVKAKKIEIDGKTYYKVIDKEALFGYNMYQKVGNEFQELSHKQIKELQIIAKPGDMRSII